MRRLQQLQRPPRLKTLTIAPRGPKGIRGPDIVIAGPGDPPEGFLGHRNSAVEWYPYWAFAKIFRNPLDPRQGPFDGGWPDWTYQNPTTAGFGVAGSVVDFVVNPPGSSGNPIAIRIQTEHFHIFVDNYKQATDEMQRVNLEKYADVVDLYDSDFMGDKSGQAIMILCKQAIGLIQRINPILSGTAKRVNRLPGV